MNSDTPRPIGIARVLTDEQAPAWLDHSLKAAAVDQARMAAQKGAAVLPKVAPPRNWRAGRQRVWLPIAGSLASLMLAIMLLTGKPTPTETTTTEAGAIETKKADAPAKQSVASEIPRQTSVQSETATATRSESAAPTAAAPAAAAPVAASTATASTAAASTATAPIAQIAKASKPSTTPSNSTQSAAKSEVDTAPKQAQTVNRQRAAAPAVAGRVNGPPPGASMAQGTNPMPPQARSQNQSAIVDAASAEAAPTAAAAPVPPAAAKARANGDSYRVDSNAAGGESALAVTTLPESAAQCIAAVQSLLGRERPAEARLLYRRCSERFTSIDWPAAMRQRFVEPATAPR